MFLVWEKKSPTQTTKRYSQLQLQVMKLLSSFSLLPKQKIHQCTKSSSCWTYKWKNLNGKNIVIVILLVASQRVAEISKWSSQM